VALEDIVAEVTPVLPLLAELPADKRASGDLESFDFRECFTVLTLLGRRLALLDLTPTSAVGVARLALRSANVSDKSPEEGFAQHAVAAVVEGFVLGREERVAQIANERAAATLRPLRIDASVFALIISGVHEPAVLSDSVDALGRAMLDADGELAIVDLTQLGDPSRDRAVAMFSADEVARMLGGACFFTGVDSRWRAAAADARLPLDAMHFAPNIAEALIAAREMGDRSSGGRNSRWRALLGRLFG
jgi:hypothetical protein